MPFSRTSTFEGPSQRLTRFLGVFKGELRLFLAHLAAERQLSHKRCPNSQIVTSSFMSDVANEGMKWVFSSLHFTCRC
jgi:hypothetical protein